jgi:hypothetical protein
MVPWYVLNGTPHDACSTWCHQATGREIWQQTRGKVHAFVSGAVASHVTNMLCKLPYALPQVERSASDMQ